MRRLTTFLAPGAAAVYVALFVGAYLLTAKGRSETPRM